MTEPLKLIEHAAKRISETQLYPLVHHIVGQTLIVVHPLSYLYGQHQKWGPEWTRHGGFVNQLIEHHVPAPIVTLYQEYARLRDQDVEEITALLNNKPTMTRDQLVSLRGRWRRLDAMKITEHRWLPEKASLQ